MPGEKLPLLARAVGGRILGPRPGRAIISFWQGIVEIILRSVALVAAIATIVPAILALGNSKNDETVGKATAVIVMCVAAAGIILEVALIILRFLNVGILNMNSRLFLLVDMSLTGVVSVGFLVGVITSGYSAQHYRGKDDALDDSFIAAAVLSFFGTVVFFILGMWIMLFVFFKWNKHVVTYTLKDAVLG